MLDAQIHPPFFSSKSKFETSSNAWCLSVNVSISRFVCGQ